MKKDQERKYLDEINNLKRVIAQFDPNHPSLNCNVATPTPTPKLITPKSHLFDSINEEGVFTVAISNQIFTDFQKLRNATGEDIRKSVIALMEYYSNYDSLNLILLHDVLAKRQSYTKFTAQLTNYLVNSQEHYKQVKVQFDSLTTRLGIFCRRGSPESSLNSTFFGAIIAMLTVHKSVEVLTDDVPISYLGNRAALKFQITKRLKCSPKIEWTKSSVKIFV